MVSATPEFLKKPIETNKDVQAWRGVLNEAAKELSAEESNGQRIPKALAGKEFTDYAGAMESMNKEGKFWLNMDGYDTPQMTAFQKQMKEQGVDSFAPLGAGANAVALLGKNSKTGEVSVVRQTFDRKEATPETPSNYDLTPEAHGIVGADGNAQDKMERKDGSMNYQITRPVVTLESIYDHLAEQKGLSSQDINRISAGMNAVVSKTVNPENAYADPGQGLRDNFGVDPDKNTGDLECFDAGTLPDWKSLEKNGKLSRKGQVIQDAMKNYTKKVPNITEGFAPAPQNEETRTKGNTSLQDNQFKGEAGKKAPDQKKNLSALDIKKLREGGKSV